MQFYISRLPYFISRFVKPPLLDLGADRRRQPIGAEGQAYFPAIPATFRAQEVSIGLRSDGFEVSDPDRKYRLDGVSLYLSVRKKAGRIYGRVQDDNGNPIPNAKIDLAGLPGITESLGHFELPIPGGSFAASNGKCNCREWL